MNSRHAVAAVALLCWSAHAQTTSQVLVDLGAPQFPTQGTVAPTWNDIVDPAAAPLLLWDTTGTSTGIEWSWAAGTFAGTSTLGTASPAAGSALGVFPPSATRDSMYGGNGEAVTFELGPFGPNTQVDLTFAASRMNVTDSRATEYVVEGFNRQTATLDPSNNTERTAGVQGMLADASGRVRVTVRAAPANSNLETFFFYLGAVQMDLATSANRPRALGFAQPDLAVSRARGKGVFRTPVTVLESTGVAEPVTLTAVDRATGSAPTWLSVPGAAVAGTPFEVVLDEAAVGLGTHTATVTARAAGVPDTELKVCLTVRDSGALNLLFYGNSYSAWNQGVPSLVGLIAEEAGHAAPVVVPRLAFGQTLTYHLTNPGQVAAITNSLPLGEEWDFVVIQGFTVNATVTLGNPTAYRANALAILNNVRNHSPGAGAVQFQPWARGWGHSFYPGTFADPLEMHSQMGATCRGAVADMNAAFGAGTAYLATPADTLALVAFAPRYYNEDLSHPEPVTTMIAAMTIYQELYRERVCELRPDFTGNSPLVAHLTSLGLGEPDWLEHAGLAERVAGRELRRYPGSGEDLLLKTGVNQTPVACPQQTIGAGDVMSVSMTTPNALYGADPALLLLDVFATGGPVGPPTPWPEVQFDLATAFVVASAPQLSQPLTFNLALGESFPGFSLLVQGVALAPSANQNNSLFTTTDAHELVMQ